MYKRCLHLDWQLAQKIAGEKQALSRITGLLYNREAEGIYTSGSENETVFSVGAQGVFAPSVYL
jgi:hypothetical protein